MYVITASFTTTVNKLFIYYQVHTGSGWAGCAIGQPDFAKNNRKENRNRKLLHNICPPRILLLPVSLQVNSSKMIALLF